MSNEDKKITEKIIVKNDETSESKESIRQIKDKAINKLRTSTSKSKLLKGYLNR